MDTELLEKLSELAGLRPDQALKESLGEDFRRILEMIERMRSVDVRGAEPLTHPLELVQPLRSDEVESATESSLLEAAPEVRDGFYIVPRVVD